MDSIWLQFALTVLFGAIAGGTTNAVAVWMLFHPYEPPRLGRWPVRALQGAIPKNKSRLAASLGRTVGKKLLTPDDLARTVNEPAFRTAFDERLSRFIASVFEVRRGSIAELLPPDLRDELQSLIEDVSATLLQRLDAYLASDDFHVTARRWAEELADEVRGESLSALLTPEREKALAEAAEAWIGEVVGGEGFSTAVGDYVDRGATRLLAPGRTFQDLLPVGLIAAFERAIAG
ncbi:MAG: DUF445 family protein, partial [Gemmatimonadetes bacterium]|nr:DUF445 family protein [Gemmatimonadota bacterium]